MTVVFCSLLWVLDNRSFLFEPKFTEVSTILAGLELARGRLSSLSSPSDTKASKQATKQPTPAICPPVVHKQALDEDNTTLFDDEEDDDEDVKTERSRVLVNMSDKDEPLMNSSSTTSIHEQDQVSLSKLRKYYYKTVDGKNTVGKAAQTLGLVIASSAKHTHTHTHTHTHIHMVRENPTDSLDLVSPAGA